MMVADIFVAPLTFKSSIIRYFNYIKQHPINLAIPTNIFYTKKNHENKFRRSKRAKKYNKTLYDNVCFYISSRNEYISISNMKLTGSSILTIVDVILCKEQFNANYLSRWCC